MPMLLFSVGIMLFGGFVHGTLGLGFPMVVTPLLALFLDIRTAILISLLPTAVVNIASLFGSSGWKDSITTYWPLAVSCLVGASMGAFVIARHDPAPFQLLLAVLIFLFLAANAIKARLSADAAPSSNVLTQSLELPSLAGMVLVGLVGGFAAGSTNVMVPILIIYSLTMTLSKNTMVQMFNMCFLAGKLAQMVIFGVEGTISLSFLASTIPFAILAYGTLLIGTRIRDKLPTELFRKIILIVLAALGVLLVIQFFTG